MGLPSLRQAWASVCVPSELVTKTRRLRLTPHRRAELKLQGQHMTYMRQLKRRQKSQVKALREKKGMGAAIALGRRLAGG